MMKQLTLFEQKGAVIRPVAFGEGGTGSGAVEERQPFTARAHQRALTENLMELIVSPSNLNRAYKRVKVNKGSPGIDKMTVWDLSQWLADHKDELINQLLEGTYIPDPIRGVIPKPDGSMRQLGIPTVRDRLVQQAILQVLEPILNSTFSESSHGFRPGRSAHTALKAAQNHVSEGYTVVVDMDIAKFFDHVNHDILMSRLSRWIGDNRLLRIVRRFLESGMMQEGICIRRMEGRRKVVLCHRYLPTCFWMTLTRN